LRSTFHYHEDHNKDATAKAFPGEHDSAMRFTSFIDYSKIEADASETVFDLKSKIADSQGHAIENQKLIYSGLCLEQLTSIFVTCDTTIQARCCQTPRP
jgi:hypothetical protein